LHPTVETQSFWHFYVVSSAFLLMAFRSAGGYVPDRVPCPILSTRLFGLWRLSSWPRVFCDDMCLRLFSADNSALPKSLADTPAFPQSSDDNPALP
jgi:hypothetical protein